MISDIKTKIRAIIGDFSKVDFQVFSYTTSNIFSLIEQNITDINEVLVNGSALESGADYSWSTTTNKITITGVTFVVDDNIEVNYDFNQYSDTELTEYIRAALVWLSVLEFGEYEINGTEIYPQPSKKDENLIALVASILIKPNYISYKLPNVAVTYPENSSKEERIQDLISAFKYGTGVVGVVDTERSYYDDTITDFPVLVANLIETFNFDLEMFYGTKTKIVVEIQNKNDVLCDLTGGKVYFTIKENYTDADSAAIFSSDLDPSTYYSGAVELMLDSDDTELVGSYFYDIKYVDVNGNTYVLYFGKIKFIDSVTKRA